MAVAPLAVAVPLLAAGLLTAVAVRLNRAAAQVIADPASFDAAAKVLADHAWVIQSDL